MGGTHPVDPELVASAQRGDVAAYGRLVQATEALVRAAVRTVVADAALVDDVVQDTYIRAHRALAGLRDPAAFPAWLRRVALSTARNVVRRRREPILDPRLCDALPAAPPDDPHGAELHDALRRAIASLPAGERRLCDRHYRGGWGTARLAQDAGVSEAVVRKRLQRLRDLLRKEIEMDLANDAARERPLSDRIVELLSRPRLVDLPENPVGEVWARVRELRAASELGELPEKLSLADVRAVGGLDATPPARAHRVDAQHVLRWDLTVPMLLAARGRAVGASLLAGGKVYRDEAEDSAHLQAFHQAELLWTGERLSAWSAMDVVEEILDELLPGAPLRVAECGFPVYADRGHEVEVSHGDRWVGVAGWARYPDRVVSMLGLDPARHTAVGVGLGLERIAALRHGIEDIRLIEAARLGEA